MKILPGMPPTPTHSLAHVAYKLDLVDGVNIRKVDR
jgi:hypothetical protein